MAVLPTYIRIITGKQRVDEPIASPIEYDASNRPTKIVYNVQGNKTEEVNIAYTAEGFPQLTNDSDGTVITYRNYSVDIPQAVLKPIQYEIVPDITDIEISNLSVTEGDPIGTQIGILNAVGGTAPFTYAVIGGDDAAKVQINGDLLELSYVAKFDDSPLDVRVRATDNNGKTFSKDFSVTVEAADYSSTLSTQFDGISESCTISNEASLNTPSFSVAFWTKFFNPGVGMDLIGKTNNFLVRQFTNGQLSFTLYGDGGYDKQYRIASGNVNNDNWHLVVMAYDSATDDLELYVDGVVSSYSIANNQAFPSGRRITSSDLEFGYFGVASHFQGNFDEITYWDKFLTVPEVFALYNAGVPENIREHSAYANVVSWWKMGESDSAPTINDNVGDNHATMVNMDNSNFVGDVP